MLLYIGRLRSDQESGSFEVGMSVESREERSTEERSRSGIQIDISGSPVAVVSLKQSSGCEMSEMSKGIW